MFYLANFYVWSGSFQFFFRIHPPPGLLTLLGPLEWYMTLTLDSALLISSRTGADLGQTSERLRYSIQFNNLLFPSNQLQLRNWWNSEHWWILRTMRKFSASSAHWFQFYELFKIWIFFGEVLRVCCSHIAGPLRYHKLHASSGIWSTGREVATVFEHCRRFTH